MVFNSLVFVPFFAIISILYFLSPNKIVQKAILTAGSYLFYGWFHLPYVLILAFSTVFDYVVGKKIASSEGRARGIWLFSSMLSNLGMLAYFKYSAFFSQQINSVIPAFPAEFNAFFNTIVLPVGISYYTFQTMSYSIDIYRRKIEPSRSLLDFSFFVAFFPQLVAGPIVRAADFLPQALGSAKVNFDHKSYIWGLSLLIMGLFGKVVIADNIVAPVSDIVFSDAQSAGFIAAWSGVLAFSAQIFFDFSGYSLSAIGVALCLGYSLPDNFRFPYAATGFSDFWRRWHISLSTWLRDYLYISLGGNRHGVLATYRNLTLTMLLGGLWHGAAWTFVVWGALHGALLIAERLAQPVINAITSLAPRCIATAFGILITYVCICFTWVFFRAESFSDAMALVRAMVNPFDLGAMPSGAWSVIAVTVAMLGYHAALRHSTIEDCFVRLSAPIRVLMLALAAFLILTLGEEQRAFIYFQF